MKSLEGALKCSILCATCGDKHWAFRIVKGHAASGEARNMRTLTAAVGIMLEWQSLVDLGEGGGVESW